MNNIGFKHQNKVKNKKWPGDTLISHAFGEIEEYIYTNSLEAFESNYAKGHRTFEVDLYLTKDKKVVLAHDWEHNADIQRQAWTEQMMPTEEEFKRGKIYNNFTPLTYIELLKLMKAYPDIWVVTDTKYIDKEHMEIQFHYMVDTAISLGMKDVLDRLIIQIYNEKMYQVVNIIHPFDSYIFTLYQRWKGDMEEFKKICNWCMDEGISVITMPISVYSMDSQQVADQYGIEIYLHTENDVLKAKNLLKSGIRGIYTDSLSVMDFTFFNILREQRKNLRNNVRKKIKELLTTLSNKWKRIACMKRIRKANKEVVIFGAGMYGHYIYDVLKCQGIDIALFCDNKKGGSIDEKTGVKIVDVDKLKRSGEDYLILLCVVDEDAYEAIEKQLKEAGFTSGHLCGMREYIDSFEVENLELSAHGVNCIILIVNFVIASATVSLCLYWHNGIILMLVLFLIHLLNNSADWVMKVFGEIELRMIIYQMHSPLKGTGRDIIKKYCSCICKANIELFVVNILYGLCKKVMPNTVGITIPIVLLILEMVLLCRQSYKIGLPKYIRQMSNCSKLYEREYVAPASVRITFPKEKKNLIYIYLESMEMTNASIGTRMTGETNDNLIPHLTRLASEHISFSNTEDYGGAQQMAGTEWTMAGLLASTSGISYILPVAANDNGQYSKFLPKLENLGDILEYNGYRNYFMCGSDAGFAGRDLFFKTHGNYEIFDLIRARKEGVIPEKYNNGFWGMEDSKLYKYAKDKLMEISQNSQPFNFTMLTVDTHHPDGYICEKCPHIYSQKYANVISCADSQIFDFLNWI